MRCTSGKPLSRNASSSRAGFSSSTMRVLIDMDMNAPQSGSICEPRAAFNQTPVPFPAMIRPRGNSQMPGARSSPRRARVLNTTKMFQGPVFEVVRETVFEPGGIRATRDIVVHSASVVVLPVFTGGRVLLIRQYRHALGGFLWELVAGRKEPDHAP